MLLVIKSISKIPVSRQIRYALVGLFLAFFISAVPAKAEVKGSEGLILDEPIVDFGGAGLFEKHGSMMLIIDTETGVIMEANDAAIKFYGYPRSELISMNINAINTMTAEEIQSKMDAVIQTTNNFFIFQHKKANDELATVEVYAYPFEASGKTYLYSVIHDITEVTEARRLYEKSARNQTILSSTFIVILSVFVIALYSVMRRRKAVEVLLKESEQGYQNLFDNMHEGYALHEIILDDQGKAVNYRFLKVNHSFEDFTGLHAEDIIGKTVLEVLPDTEAYWIESYGNVALKGEKMTIENYSKDLDRYYLVNVYNVGYRRFITVFIDVTENKKKEIEIQFLNNHDLLTGLFNRSYMEEKLNEFDTPASLPLSIIMADVNGLKLSNDAFGHAIGDELLISASQAFREVFREDDVISRIGGDEFLILLPNTSKEVVIHMRQRLKESIEGMTVGPIELSISLGDATKNSVDEEIQNVYKKAEDRMYHNKLMESHDSRTSLIHYIFDKIEKDYVTLDNHQKRVGQLAKEAGQIFELNENEHEKLIEASLYHDVGLVAIDGNVANKPGSLNEDEWAEIRRHVECGYRILCAISEFAETADIILGHHERFDGSGYPKNLRGDEIPYLSRIIAILEAYDAMTHEQFYKAHYSKEGAIAELEAGAGTQFDPVLVKKFVAFLRG